MADSTQTGRDPLFRALLKAILTTAGIIVLLWFAYRVRSIVLLFFLALVLAMVLDVPVTWLERHGVRRVVGSVAVGIVVLALVALICWLVGPRLAVDVLKVAESIPGFAQALSNRVAALLNGYPQLQQRVLLTDENLSQLAPRLPALVNRAWGLALMLIGLLVFFIVLISVVLYLLVNPRPLLQGYVRAIPEVHREAAVRAFVRSSRAVVGWMWAAAIIGAMEAIIVFFFLTFMGVPGALVWAALALSAELVPKLGPYIMAIPPVLVALSVDPILALWVVLFYFVMGEVMGDVVGPRIRASTMDVHPVITLFLTLALIAAFGVLGAFVATPLAGFLKAYYEEFYLVKRSDEPENAERVERMLG